MAITFDGPSKIIALDGATQESVQNIYSRWVDWFATGTNSKFLPAFRTIGDPLGADGYGIPVIAFLTNGWLIRPLAGNYELTLVGGILVGPNGSSGFAPVASGENPIRIIARPVQTFAYTVGGQAGPTEAQIAAAVLAAAQAAPIHSDVQRVNGVEIAGTGVTGDSFRPA